MWDEGDSSREPRRKAAHRRRRIRQRGKTYGTITPRVTFHSPRANVPLFDLHARPELFAAEAANSKRPATLLYHPEERAAARSRAWSERLKRGTNSSRETSSRWRAAARLFLHHPALSARPRFYAARELRFAVLRGEFVGVE